MNQDFNIDNLLKKEDEKYNDYLINNNYYLKCDYIRLKDNNFYLTEVDFYPPYDDRVFESYVEDIDNGDNFADYCEYIFKLYEEEGYYD